MRKPAFVILTLLYFAGVAFAIYFATTSAIAGNAHNFLEYHKEQIEDFNNKDRDHILLGAATVANSRGNFEAYIVPEAIVVSDDNNLGYITVLPFLMASDTLVSDHLAFILRNAVIFDEEEDRLLPVTVLRLRIEFSGVVPALGSSVLLTTINPIFDINAGFTVINLQLLPSNISITRVSFLLALQQGEYDFLYSLDEKAIQTINDPSTRLSNSYNIGNINDGTLVVDHSLIKMYGDFSQFGLYLGTVIPAVILLTYLLFFNKHVITIIREKRHQKRVRDNPELYKTDHHDWIKKR